MLQIGRAKRFGSLAIRPSTKLLIFLNKSIPVHFGINVVRAKRFRKLKIDDATQPMFQTFDRTLTVLSQLSFGYGKKRHPFFLFFRYQTPNTFSAFPCAIFSRSACVTGICSRNARAFAID